MTWFWFLKQPSEAVSEKICSQALGKGLETTFERDQNTQNPVLRNAVCGENS